MPGPEAYIKFFGANYQPPAYIKHAYEEARNTSDPTNLETLSSYFGTIAWQLI